MQLDLNGLNGSSSLVARPVTLHFAAAPNSFFSILVFNDLLRGIQPGSMALALQNSSSAGVNAPGYSNLPAALRSSLKRLTVEKLPSGQGFDLAVRDSNTGFTFFNIEGHQYNYDAAAQSFTITGGRLLISKQFASTLGIPSEAGSLAGIISIGAAMQPIQIDQVVSGETKSMVLPPMQHAVGPGVPNLVPGPDVIVGDVEDVAQFNSPVGTQVGLAIGTDSCNNGDQPVNWLALPQYRSSCRSAEPLSHERGRQQRRALRTNRPVMDETHVPGITGECLRHLQHQPSLQPRSTALPGLL